VDDTTARSPPAVGHDGGRQWRCGKKGGRCPWISSMKDRRKKMDWRRKKERWRRKEMRR
jgi:hypothetical protein